jgi:sec-independent protein translocase protein TatB
MFDIGWTELLVIGVVALIVIGPRDLPAALHTFGKYVGKLRSMAREFQHGIDEIVHQQELRELQQSVQKFSSPEQAIENYIDGLGSKGGKSVPPVAAAMATADEEAEADEADARVIAAARERARPGAAGEENAIAAAEVMDASQSQGQHQGEDRQPADAAAIPNPPAPDRSAP